MRLIQVTLTAAATPITTNTGLYASTLTIQANTAANVRVGDNTVSTSKGILLSLGAPGGSATFTMAFPRGTHLSDWYLFGTTTQLVDVLYESAE